MRQRAYNYEPFSKRARGRGVLFSFLTIEVSRLSETSAEYLPNYTTSRARKRDDVMDFVVTVVKRSLIRKMVTIFEIISLISGTFPWNALAQSVKCPNRPRNRGAIVGRRERFSPLRSVHTGSSRCSASGVNGPVRQAEHKPLVPVLRIRGGCNSTSLLCLC